MILEYLKVLAGPLATIVAAMLVTGQAVRTYRKQKVFDRRLDWFEETHRLLGRTADTFRWAGAANASQDTGREFDRMREALALSTQVAERGAEAFLYGSETSLIALRRLGQLLEDAHREIGASGRVPEELGRRVAIGLLAAANDIAADTRHELGLKTVDLQAIEQRALNPQTAA